MIGIVGFQVTKSFPDGETEENDQEEKQGNL